MAKMITRTVVGTQITAKVVNKVTDEITSKPIILDAKLTADDSAKAIRLASKSLCEDEVVISVADFTPVEKLYGVSVDDFMAVAKELDPTTRKPINQ